MANAAPQDPPKTNHLSILKNFPELFHVFDKMPGAVFPRLGNESSSGAPLVENNDAVVVRVEEPPMNGTGPSPRSAVDEENGRSLGISRLLPINLMTVADLQTPGFKGFYPRKQILISGGDVHSR